MYFQEMLNIKSECMVVRVLMPSLSGSTATVQIKFLQVSFSEDVFLI